MTSEEKQLLLKDLCTRLLYGIKLHIEYYDLQGDGELASRDVKLTTGNICYCFDNGPWVDFKPYLRPMSSMTEEERELYKGFAVAFGDSRDIMLPNYAAMDWLNKNMFDYRGLIEKGLALEVPEGMYKEK